MQYPFVQKIVIGFHIPGDDLQDIIPVSGYGEALHHLGQCFHMGFEYFASPVRMFDHGYRQKHVNLESQFPGIQKRDFSLDQAGLFQFPDAAPDRRSRHPGALRQFDLAQSRVSLQGVEQAVV